MPPKIEKEPINVVDIDIGSTDDDDGGAGVSLGNSDASSNKAASETGPEPLIDHHHNHQVTSAPTTSAIVSDVRSFEHRSFWKAGSYAVDPSTKPPSTQGPSFSSSLSL